MGVTTSNKTISTDIIECGGIFEVTLSLAAEPNILTNPADIVLILDRSGSMSGTPLTNLKSGAKKFVEIIADATNDGTPGQIGYGSRIAIVSFADTATENTQLITSVADLDTAIDSLAAGGLTNHADGFTKAMNLLDNGSGSGKIMVMFTDGKTTVGANPNDVATQAKAKGMIIYCIGLNGNGGYDEAALDAWSSDPDSAYVLIAPTDAELEQVFEDLAKNITNAGATNIEILEKISECMKIQSMHTPTKGTVSMVDDNTLEWKIPELGKSGAEGAALTFEVKHIGPCYGTIEVNKSIEYSDNEGNQVKFPSPEIFVDCDVVITAETCPEPVEITIEGCSDAVVVDAGDTVMQSMGRMIELSTTIKNVCPKRRVALAAIVTELDDEGNEYKRGMKTMVVPAHYHTTCRDVHVQGMMFVLPEELDETGDPTSICNARAFKARFIAHYIDSDYAGCNLDG